MQVTYDGAHSILIGTFKTVTDEYGRAIERYDDENFVNTWDYYGLIPQSVPVIDPPDVQENTIEVPGSNGIVDLSEVLLGYPLYYNRSGSLDFYVDHTHPRYISWDSTYDRLLNDLHGTNKKVILTDSRGYYYDGRIKVNKWKSDKLCSSITLDYNFAPYKRMLFTTMDDWLWDPFDFVVGTIPDKQGWYVRTVNSSTSIDKTYTTMESSIEAGTMPVVPDILFEVSADPIPTYDTMDPSTRPYILYAIGKKKSEVADLLEHGNGYKSYIRDSERYGVTNKFVKHDPLITLGSHPNAENHCFGIRLVNNNLYDIKMSIDFRQGRL